MVGGVGSVLVSRNGMSVLSMVLFLLRMILLAFTVPVFSVSDRVAFMRMNFDSLVLALNGSAMDVYALLLFPF